MESNQIKNLINEFLSLIFSTFKAKYNYLDLKAHYDEKCYDISNPKLINKRNELIMACAKSKENTNSARLKYESLNNSLNKFCLNLNDDELKQIVQYFDYTVSSKRTKTQIINSIIKLIIEDIKKLYDYVVDFPQDLLSYNNYQGPITLVYIILKTKELASQNIKKYRDIEKRLIEIELTERIYKKSYSKLGEKLNELESSMFNTLFRKKMMESIREDKYAVYVLITQLDSEKYELSEQYDVVIENRNISYENYKDIISLLPSLINKLGEKSLKKLIIDLKITIPKTDDNYFNEKEEMKIAIKKWFNYETKKLDMQFNMTDRVVIERGEQQRKVKKY